MCLDFFDPGLSVYQAIIDRFQLFERRVHPQMMVSVRSETSPIALPSSGLNEARSLAFIAALIQRSHPVYRSVSRATAALL
jgi:hypothetical protein